MEEIIPYGRQSLTEEDIAAVVSVLRGSYLTQGPAIDAFENALAEFIGCKHVVVVNSGTAALHIAYAALGIGPSDAVIVPAITFAATANAAVYCGATPIFADVDPNSGLMTKASCLEALGAAVKLGFRPRLVVPVHYAGLPVDMSGIIAAAGSYDCQVFEDACHAIGAEYRPGPTSEWCKVGNWANGSIGAAFSFHPVKHIATGEGGALATNDDSIAAKARMLRTHGITKDSAQYLRSGLATDAGSQKLNPWYHEMQVLGWNYRMPDICAALGTSQTKRLPEFVANRRAIAKVYQNSLNVLSHLKLPDSDTEVSTHSWHLYPVKIDFKSLGLSRAEVMMKLRDQGVGTQVHYLPVPEMPYYQSQYSHILNSLNWTGAKAFYESELSIPMYPSLSGDQVTNVANTFARILGT